MPELAGPARGRIRIGLTLCHPSVASPKLHAGPRGAVGARAHRCPPVPMEREPGQTAGRGRLVSE